VQKSDFSFILPEHLIARYPLDQRSHSRLLVANANNHHITDSIFHQLSAFLASGDILVFNDSRVIPARLLC
jgi:S-adenosylmethionine:tRNA ribosyltransferase-isomerase